MGTASPACSSTVRASSTPDKFNIQLFADNLQNTTATMSKEMKTFYELFGKSDPCLSNTVDVRVLKKMIISGLFKFVIIFH